jgi:cytochrome c-type biogenesis protein CcmF
VNPVDQFPLAPPWGIALGWVGKALVFWGMAFFAGAAILSAWKDRQNWVGRLLFAGGLCVVAAMGTLVALLLGQQYQYLYVFNNTTRDMPTLYRLSAAWAAQEGSFLLWTLTSAVFTVLAWRRVGGLRRWYSVLASVFLVAMLAIVAYESPFKIPAELVDSRGRIHMPPTGTGLNPVLENYWMAIHPWVIFIGFGSLLALFAWAGAGAIARETSWQRPIRPWALFSMTALGTGLVMGGLWAYETLGWGGFWAWDPVENVSLVPFLATAALVHSLYLAANRGLAVRWNFVAAMLPFVSFAYGTYLTRSGALANVSVHSFAKMTEGAHGVLAGLVIGAVLCFVVLSVLSFRGVRTSAAKGPGPRGWGMFAGICLLYLIALFAGLGMSKPFFSAVVGQNASVVGEEVYNRFAAIPYLFLMVGMAIAPFLGWKRTRPERLSQVANVTLVSVLLFGVIAMGLVFAGLTADPMEPAGRKTLLETMSDRPQLALFFLLIFATTFAVVGNLWRMIERLRARSGGWATFLTHVGVSLLMLGLVVSRAFEKTASGVITPSHPQQLVVGPAAYLAMLERMPTHEEVFDSNCRIPIRLASLSEGFGSWVAQPVFFYEPMAAMLRGELRPVTRPYIRRSFLYDLYLAIGEPSRAFQGSFSLKPGETRSLENGQIQVKYVASTREGEPGQPGAKFGVELLITYEGQTHRAQPTIELTGNGMENVGANVGTDFVAYLERLDAASGEATIRMDFQEPYMFTQLFFKPLTGLVWMGAGILTLGGLLSVRQTAKKVHSKTDETGQAS